MRLVLLGLSSLLAACAVAVSGVIGFVGLIIPHLMRLAVARAPGAAARGRGRGGCAADPGGCGGAHYRRPHGGAGGHHHVAAGGTVLPVPAAPSSRVPPVTGGGASPSTAEQRNRGASQRVMDSSSSGPMQRTALLEAVKAAQAGDQHAFETIFRGHGTAVYSLALHFIRDRSTPRTSRRTCSCGRGRPCRDCGSRRPSEDGCGPWP